jgi:uncharacterized CHY-type Zn-finger protein
MGGIKMNSCMRCGEKLSHNYLVAIFTIINEKRKRLIVCLKCKEILNKKENKSSVRGGIEGFGAGKARGRNEED